MRMAFETAMRSAVVSLLEAYATSASLKLQVYRARPRSIYTPTAFIEAQREQLVEVGPNLFQRVVTTDVRVLHGSFDGGDEVDQRDAFVDGFASAVQDDPHAVGGNTLIVVASVADDPEYVPAWLAPDEQRSYYATVISVEGRLEDY